MAFSHHTLIAYQVALEVSRSLRLRRPAPKDKDLMATITATMDRATMNIARARTYDGTQRAQLYREAMADAAAAHAGLDILETVGSPRIQNRLDRLGSILYKLSR